MEDYLKVDINILFGNYGNLKVHLNDTNKLSIAEEWCNNNVGESSPDTWWIAPYVKAQGTDERGTILVQGYYIVFIDEKNCFQFKLMGF